MRIVLCAAGSGGHVYPALALAEQLRQLYPRADLLWCGTHRFNETSLDGAIGTRRIRLQVEKIPVVGKSRIFFYLQCCFFLLKLGSEVGRLTWLFLRQRPDVVVGFGAVSTIAPLVAATILRVPTLIHEQNAVPGIANRMLSRLTTVVAVNFEQSRSAFLCPVRVCGNPLRTSLRRVPRRQALAEFSFDSDYFTLLVCGGSQGSVFLNTLLPQVMALIASAGRARVQIIHGAGIGKEASLKEAYAGVPARAYVCAYLTDIHNAYSAADAVITRAGAMTLSELAYFSLPAVLIPYPYAGAHQLANARVVEAAEAAFVVEQAAASPERIASLLSLLQQDSGRRRHMAEAMRHLYKPDAGRALAELVKGLTKA